MFSINESGPSSLDEAIDEANRSSKEMFSISKLIHGQGSKPVLKRQKTKELKPIVFVRFNTRKAGTPKPVTLRALLDSGGSGSLVTAKFAKKLRLKKSGEAKTVWTTPAGALKTTVKCRAQFMLPELHDNRLIEWDLHVTKDLGTYDMIIGRDILQDLKIDIKFSTSTIEWDNSEIPLKDSDTQAKDGFFVQDPQSVDDATDRLKHILDAKYEKADLEEIVDAMDYLTPEERTSLQHLMNRYETLFDGSLGTWDKTQYKIDLKKGAEPYHARAFPIPRIHLNSLKTEVERLCKIGVLKKVNRSSWAAPTFIIPKKDGSVRFISDFRELNKRIQRRPYPIPKIQDMLLNLEGFQYATSLDLNMGYYHIELTPGSKELCTIVLPFGKFEYQRLPMGLCNSPDIFQEKMSDLMEGLEYVRAYIDDLLICTKGSYQDHLEKLEEVFKRLRQAGLKVNAKKSFFAKGELEYLGYWISRRGIQPLKQKVEAICKIAAPKNKKELRGFIGLVNYYRDMWIRRSHLLAPLAALTSKTVKWRWGNEEQQAFDAIKKVISREALLAYPDFGKTFVIHTDASHTQLGAVISQDDKPIAFYSRKLKPEQTRYTTTERELLSIVETLKEFRNILLGHKIVVHTDHKNLTCKNFNTERVMRWRLILEEYGPELKYIKGEHNIVADALSRLEMMPENPPEDESGPPNGEEMAQLFCVTEDEIPFPTETYPLTYKYIRQEQIKDAKLQKDFKRNVSKYKKETFKHGGDDLVLITHDGRIVIPNVLQKRAVEWYHAMLMHPGETRTELTIAQHYYWQGMRNTVKKVCQRCKSCQLHKKKLLKLGHLPEKEPDVEPWSTVCIDLIGPYTLGDEKKKNTTTLHCLTMIDPSTGWFEIVEIPDKQADTISNLLEQEWLMRYPWPQKVIMDRGREFMGEVVTMLQNDYGIKRRPITTRNPQANSMVERAHQTIHNLIKVQGIKSKDDLPEGWGGILAAVRFAMRATVHTTNRATPMQLVMGRDALHNVQFIADWTYIKQRKQTQIRKNNQRENAKRINYTYQVGEKVMVKQDPNRKHGTQQYVGPYTVSTVYDNGTVRLTRSTPSGGVVTQTWNIRQIYPYRA